MLLTVALVMAAVEGVLLVMKPRLPQLVLTCTPVSYTHLPIRARVPIP